MRTFIYQWMVLRIATRKTLVEIRKKICASTSMRLKRIPRRWNQFDLSRKKCLSSMNFVRCHLGKLFPVARAIHSTFSTSFFALCVLRTIIIMGTATAMVSFFSKQWQWMGIQQWREHLIISVVLLHLHHRDRVYSSADTCAEWTNEAFNPVALCEARPRHSNSLSTQHYHLVFFLRTVLSGFIRVPNWNCCVARVPGAVFLANS